MNLRRVGVLGGMGPAATVLLMQKIIAATPARDDEDHLPLIVDQNPQVPSRIAHLITHTGENPAPVLAAMAQRLEAAGALALAMPCNTAHFYAPAIRNAVSIPLIDMVALSVAHADLLLKSDRRLGILASPAVRQSRIFDDQLAKVGVTAVYPDDEPAVLAIIQHVKAKGATSEAAAALKAASAGLLSRGTQVQMIACTEFSLMPHAVETGVTSFDTLDQLVRGIIVFATSANQSNPLNHQRPSTKSEAEFNL